MKIYIPFENESNVMDTYLYERDNGRIPSNLLEPIKKNVENNDNTSISSITSRKNDVVECINSNKCKCELCKEFFHYDFTTFDKVLQNII
jgi:hypothetical protein